MQDTIAERLKMLIPKIDQSLKGYDQDTLETSGSSLNSVRDEIRELIQARMCDTVKPLIKKLKKDHELSSEDKQLIEKWLVGDAAYYTKIENNLSDWVGECKRLCNMISSYSYEGVENDDSKLLSLGALLTDLKYTLDDVIRYNEALGRVDRYKNAIASGTITREAKQALADLMERQLYSREY